MYLGLMTKIEDDDKRKPFYVYLVDITGNFVPWQPSQTDMLSEDWKISDI